MIATARWTTVLVLLLLGAAPAPGQERLAVPGFSTVRLSSPEYTGVAILVGVSSDTLELGVEGRLQSIFVPIRSLAGLEYRRPATRLERATRGALWGAGTLGVTGFLLADRGEDTSEVEVALYSVLTGVVWGGAIGLLIRQSRWEPIELVDR